LLERISHGGMAEVFRAKTQGTAGFERVVAIKLLLPQVANDAEFITMLIDEAKIAGQLSHANIAQIFDLGQVDGRYYIVQEYVPGHDLRAILHHLEDIHSRLGVAQACHVILKICEALDYAHNKRDAQGQPLNLVHRDISPQNVIVSHEGEVKLIDFGIVKAEGRATRTLAGLVKGKFAYMSPEQIRGLPVDRRSDVFACGIILHELLTGLPLFKRGSEFETLQRARAGEIEPPSRLNRDVPPELDRIVLKALARHVDDRYQTAIALRDELWEFVRTAGLFHNRDQLAGWMREVFGEPRAVEMAIAHSQDELGHDKQLDNLQPPAPQAPGPRLPDRMIFEDEDVEHMTVVDADLQSRLRLVVEDADTVAAEPDDALAGIAAAGGPVRLRPPEFAPAPALRDLAEAAQIQPDRAVFRPGERLRGEGSSSIAGELHSEPSGDDEETTSARAGDPLPDPTIDPALWFEPQTPTRRRTPAPDDPDLDDAASPRAPDRMDAPIGPSIDQPAFAPPLVPTAAPDARTIGPAHEMRAPFPGGIYPPVYQHPGEPGFHPPSDPHAMHGQGPPMDGRPQMHDPMQSAPMHLPPMPPPGHMLAPHQGHPDPYGMPPPGMWPGPGFPGEHDLRPASNRFLIAAAIAILVAAVTVSIVLAVTGG
ncbi:MAG TPA: protein kinase, partial [Kofleriaceae bacterium]|nr:protein kinase [Kofleriaceae bacterium]